MTLSDTMKILEEKVLQGCSDKELLDYARYYFTTDDSPNMFECGCNVERIVDRRLALKTCPKCGLSETYQTDLTLYNHPMRKVQVCKYKRENNFREILNQFLCYETVDHVILDEIKNEIKTDDTISVSIPVIRSILKRKKLMKYKKCIYYIYFKLTGKEPPKLSYKEYDQAQYLFKVISNIYTCECNKQTFGGCRKSFISYPFILKKILIIMDKSEYAKYIQPLKVKKKRENLERIWEIISNNLNNFK